MGGALLASALLLGGCGDDTSASPGPSRSPSPSASSPHESASPTVRPATGAVLDQEDASMKAPTGFVLMPKMVDFRTAASSKAETNDVVSMGEGPWGDDPLDLAVRLSISSSSYLVKPRRVDDVELDGVTAYHLVGRIDRYTIGEMYGAVRDGANLDIEFALSDARSPADRRELIESSLATFHWK